MKTERELKQVFGVLAIILVGLFVVVLPIHVHDSKLAIIHEQAEILPSDIQWATISLAGKRIGCYAADSATNPRIQYPNIITDILNRGANVSDITDAMMPVTAALLANYDLVWFNEGADASLNDVELGVINTWLNQGGRVLCTGDDETSPANDVADYLGFDWFSHYSEMNITTAIFPHPISQGVNGIYFSNPSNLRSCPVNATLVVKTRWYDIVMAGTSNLGKVVVISDDNIFINYTQADNAIFANNVFGWLSHVNNFPPRLVSGMVFPANGNQTTLYNYSVVYSDPDNSAPCYVNVSIDGVVFPMMKADPFDDNYTDGSLYYFTRYLQPGLHNYLFTTRDDTFLNSTAVTSGPFVQHVNIAPILDGFSVSPLVGNSAHNFTFNVIYLDLNNDAPSYMRVLVNGLGFEMHKQDPGDNNYTDGCVYTLSRRFSPGSYTWNITCSDGTVPTTTSQGTFSAYSSNTQPPSLSNPSVTPEKGKKTTVFTFTVIFTDLDNDEPSFINISINGLVYPMSAVDIKDTDTTDGKAYRYSTQINSTGMTRFQINCSDGNFFTNTSLITKPEILPDPSFLEQYGLLIGISGMAIAAIATVLVISKNRKKGRKNKAELAREARKQLISEIEPKKAAAKKAGTGIDEAKPMTSEDLAELKKTEQEVTAKLERKICVVHKGPIKGANYACPHCETFYCRNCVVALANAGEKCWSCGNKLELDESFINAPIVQALNVENAKFYCDFCKQYREYEKPNYVAWENCPTCGKPMVLTRSCTFCGQPIALGKDLFDTYKGKLMQCPNCNKNVVI
ncbi:MAG: hypothetical protein Q6373_009590 [Candidatus Sigynarchaeota archaeon]